MWTKHLLKKNQCNFLASLKTDLIYCQVCHLHVLTTRVLKIKIQSQSSTYTHLCISLVLGKLETTI